MTRQPAVVTPSSRIVCRRVARHRHLDRLGRPHETFWQIGERARLPRTARQEPSQLAQLTNIIRRHLTTLPDSGELWRVRGKRTIRRWLLEKTAQHLYYVHNREREEVLVLAMWDTRRGRGPKL